jgi:hypothetical protein
VAPRIGEARAKDNAARRARFLFAPSAHPGRGVKLRRLVAHPFDEDSDVVMCEQALETVVMVAQFLIGEGRVDLPVTDRMQKPRLFALVAAGHEMMLGDANDPERARAKRAGF